MRTIDFVANRRQFLIGGGAALGTVSWPVRATMPNVIEPQPYFASIKRAIEALATVGQPIAKVDAERLAELAAKGDPESVGAAEQILGRLTLARVDIGSDGIGRAVVGGADRTLVEQGWRSFLVRVSNPYGISDRFNVSGGYYSPGGMSSESMAEKSGLADMLLKAPFIEEMWLLAQSTDVRLSGASVEYRVIELFSRDHGIRTAHVGFGAGVAERRGQLYRRVGSSWNGGTIPIQFNALRSHAVDLSILDHDGVGCMASLIIKDARDHVYPPQPMRIAPDMAFHPQVYRADGERVTLPGGEYVIIAWRGPEYLRSKNSVRIGEAEAGRRIQVKLQRWIDPANWGWYSGDTHIHASGCSHYSKPTEGVNPETMIRHVRGEGLSIGNVLTWGPAWYYQRQFFSGKAISPEAALEHPDLQAANNATFVTKPTAKDGESLLRYDIEVSQFPSSMSGHAILLRVKEWDYPGTKAIEEWPSWNLPIFRWGRAQGALVGFAHCGLGMGRATAPLPHYEIPPFDSIGTNEAIVDVTHELCDFLSGCEFEPVVELNAWYHMLNCGFRLAMVGETDYPCVSDERPGVGRSYVQLPNRPTNDAGYNAWVEGVRSGRLYCGDGRSHFLKVAINGRSLGETVELPKAGSINVTGTAAARLEPNVTDETRAIKSGWHLERARIGETRTVPLELVVNGVAVERVAFLADGKPRPITFKTRIERSSWVALRILPSGHTHPIFVNVGGKPIRASRRSAEWLRKCVDALWQEKHRMIRESERAAAAEAYDHARRTYDRIIAESDVA